MVNTLPRRSKLPDSALSSAALLRVGWRGRSFSSHKFTKPMIFWILICAQSRKYLEGVSLFLRVLLVASSFWHLWRGLRSDLMDLRALSARPDTEDPSKSSFWYLSCCRVALFIWALLYFCVTGVPLLVPWFLYDKLGSDFWRNCFAIVRYVPGILFPTYWYHLLLTKNISWVYLTFSPTSFLFCCLIYSYYAEEYRLR